MINWKQSNTWLILGSNEWKNSQIHDWSIFNAVKYMTENGYTGVWRNKFVSVSKITAAKYMTVESNTWVLARYCV